MKHRLFSIFRKSRSVERSFFKQGLGISALIALGLAMVAPTAAVAGLEARMCLNIPQGHNFDSDSGFMVVVRKTPAGAAETVPKFYLDAKIGDGDIKLGLNVPSNINLDQNNIFGFNGKTLKVGRTCKKFALGTTGENAIDAFSLESDTQIDAMLLNFNDFCADELYLQITKDGVLQTTARFLNSKQRCWGDDFAEAKLVRRMNVVAFQDLRPKLKLSESSGQWEVLCRTLECNFAKTISKTNAQSTSGTNSKTHSDKVTESIKAGLKVEGFSSEVSISHESMDSVTRSVTENISESMTRSKTLKVGYDQTQRKDLNIASIWQYSLNNTMSNGDQVKIYTDYYGCSSESYAPMFAPGSIDADQSCQGGLIGLNRYSQHLDQAIDCGPEGCIASGPACDTTTVVGQCSFPREEAMKLCDAHGECKAVVCNSKLEVCQARRVTGLISWNGMRSYIVE